MLESAKRPVILAGAEVGRFGLHDELTKLVERLNVPIASTLLGKSIIREDHPLYVGVYSGLVARDEEGICDQTDCLLILGLILSDVEDLDARSALFSDGHTIHATADRVAIKHHRYDSIRFEDFVKSTPMPRCPPFPKPSRPARARRTYASGRRLGRLQWRLPPSRYGAAGENAGHRRCRRIALCLRRSARPPAL